MCVAILVDDRFRVLVENAHSGGDSDRGARFRAADRDWNRLADPFNAADEEKQKSAF